MPERFSQLTDDKSIPLALFSLRVLSVLESLVAYIKDTYDLTYHETAVLLNRDDRTVWTVYQRAKKKGGLP